MGSDVQMALSEFRRGLIYEGLKMLLDYLGFFSSALADNLFVTKHDEATHGSSSDWIPFRYQLIRLSNNLNN